MQCIYSKNIKLSNYINHRESLQKRGLIPQYHYKETKKKEDTYQQMKHIIQYLQYVTWRIRTYHRINTEVWYAPHLHRTYHRGQQSMNNKLKSDTLKLSSKKITN
jgi:hypothetical protein